VTTAEAIITARRAAGLSQAGLAARSGVAQPNISAYESGTRKPSPVMLRRLVAAARPRPSDVLSAHRGQVLALARANKADEVRVFGSVANGRDTADSDIDLLVRFRSGASLLDQANLTIKLTELLGVRVDVVSEGGLTDRHADILAEAVEL
jgi:predicted nucleotidyltransferase/DNA-binding XRE family transcriptional regulator